VSCSSWKFRDVDCQVHDAPGKITSVVVARKKSKSPCKSGKTFGFDKKNTIIWVKQGCRAIFQVCFRVRTSGIYNFAL